MISEKEIADEIGEDDAEIVKCAAELSREYLKACSGDFNFARIMAYGTLVAARQAYDKLTKTQQAIEAVEEAG